MFSSFILIGLVAALVLNLVLHRLTQGKSAALIKVFQVLMLLLCSGVMVASMSGSNINTYLLIAAYFFILLDGVFRTLAADFWGKLGLGSLVVVLVMVGGYLYTMLQIPYGDSPYAAVAINQPIPLEESNLPMEAISGLPLINGGGKGLDVPLMDAPGRRVAHNSPAQAMTLDSHSLNWEMLETIMRHDAHIRDVLIDLRERQARELSDMLAQLNTASVAGTTMHRYAIDPKHVDDLLKDGAISTSRHKTFLETWKLLDKDEQAFRARQTEALFRSLLELLVDEQVDETHRVELIDFMVEHYARDVRLVRPLISLYDALDEEYPRQKRLNREFLDLYLQRRTALLHGFEALGHPALQALLDYRRKTVSTLRYSQVELDRFLARCFHIRIQPLYGVAAPISVHQFLNREKYPVLRKWSGPSYEQDYIRRNLIRISRDNWIPRSDETVMDMSESDYQNIQKSFAMNASSALDRWVVHPDPVVRANLAWYLAERKDPYTMPLIVELMQDTHPEVRRMAAIAAGNFRLLDMQGANDPKFIAIVEMLINYRTNADAFARAQALAALTTVADRQKALYVLDLLLNDGTRANSVLGESAPAWKTGQEKTTVASLADTLNRTPEEIYVKTQALKALLAVNSPDSLGILLHYLEHIYATHDTHPNLLRYLIPHWTLPQEAENVEDAILHLAHRYKEHPDTLQHPLKTLRAFLASAYADHRSSEFFQYLGFLRAFDALEYQSYLEEIAEHIIPMKIKEYFASTYGFWLVVWPVFLLGILILQYGFGFYPGFISASRKNRMVSNRYANPAADIRNHRQTPASAIVPVKVGTKS